MLNPVKKALCVHIQKSVERLPEGQDFDKKDNSTTASFRESDRAAVEIHEYTCFGLGSTAIELYGSPLFSDGLGAAKYSRRENETPVREFEGTISKLSILQLGRIAVGVFFAAQQLED